MFFLQQKMVTVITFYHFFSENSSNVSNYASFVYFGVQLTHFWVQVLSRVNISYKILCSQLFLSSLYLNKILLHYKNSCNQENLEISQKPWRLLPHPVGTSTVYEDSTFVPCSLFYTQLENKSICLCILGQWCVWWAMHVMMSFPIKRIFYWWGFLINLIYKIL